MTRVCDLGIGDGEIPRDPFIYSWHHIISAVSWKLGKDSLPSDGEVWSFLTLSNSGRSDFCGRSKMADMFQGWRVPVLRQDWQKQRFLESVFGPKLIVFQQNALSQRLPMAAVGFSSWKFKGQGLFIPPPSSAIMRPAKIAPAISCGGPKKDSHGFFLLPPSDKNQEPTNQPVIFRLYPFVKSTWAAQKASKKYHSTTGWLHPSHSPLQFVTKCSKIMSWWTMRLQLYIFLGISVLGC